MTDKVLLGVVAPAKPIGEMTDDERRAFARQIAGMMTARYKAAVELNPPPSEAPPPTLADAEPDD